MKQIKKTIIFYFTGTGNSLYVAKEISKTFKQVDIIAISQAIDKKEFDYTDYNEVGFVMPLYFMGMPVIVEEFIERINISNATYIFSVITRAYTKGLVLTKINKILRKQEKKLSYGQYISFPDCYIRWAGAHSKEAQQKVFCKAESKLDAMRKELLERKMHVQGEGIVLNTVSIGVNKVWKARLASMSKTFKVNQNCIKCGICVRACPAKNIKLEGGILKWDRHCQDCMACVQSCPHKAIYFNKRTKDKRRYKNPNVSRSELLYWRT